MSAAECAHGVEVFAGDAATIASSAAFGQSLNGFDSTRLPPVTNAFGDWGLTIVVLNVGQADAILVMTPNRDVCLIESDRTKSAGHQIAEVLRSAALNYLGIIKTVDLPYTTHYDRDHMAGSPA